MIKRKQFKDIGKGPYRKLDGQFCHQLDPSLVYYVYNQTRDVLFGQFSSKFRQQLKNIL